MKPEDREQLLIWEKRLLFLAFICGILASILFLTSFSTEYWVHVVYTKSEYRDEDKTREHYYKTGHYHGLWRICREEYRNFSTTDAPQHSTYCRAMWFTLPETTNLIKPEHRAAENQILDFRRSTVAVGFICLILSGIANCFVFFSLGQLRYMYKRLSGCLCLITGASSWVTIEVFKQSVYFEEKHMKQNIAPHSIINFLWSYHLVWVVLVLYIFDGLVMFICSRKRKGIRARSMKEARENEPIHLGRV